MAVLTVGSGLQFQTVKAAVDASHDGDTIYVQAGTYLNDFSIIKTKISIVGVGGMANFVATVSPTNGKAILTVNTDVTLDHVELQGAKVHDLNGAGVRYQGGNLTITNSYIHDNQNGILGGSGVDGTGTVTIDHTEFGHNGAGGGGYSHNIYIGTIDTFTFTNSYTHDAVVGHELKSRAANTIITNDRIYDLNGNASYNIDLPNGGNAIIENNIIQQGPNSPNYTLINYGGNLTKVVPWLNSSLLVEDNTLINQIHKKSVAGVMNRLAITAQLVDNHYFGLDAAQIAVGNNVRSGDQSLASMPALDTSHPWADSPWDHIVWGGIGDDVVHGTAARDMLVGGTGRDTFIVRDGGGSDTIADFRPGSVLNEVVRFEGYGFSKFSGVKAAMTQHGSDVALDLGNGDVLTFQNTHIGDFTANDFTFHGLNDPPLASPVAVQPFALPNGGAFTSNIKGDSKANLLTGTDGNDRINGSYGADTMKGGAGDDQYFVDNSGDHVVENPGEGIDLVTCDIASYTLTANVENLNLRGASDHKATGNALGNIIRASSANDTIGGAGGNDMIYAGVGADVLTGGAGNDMFIFTKLGARSTIADFHIGQDLLDLRPLLPHYNGSDPLADGVLAISANGPHGTLISADPTLSGTMHDLVALQGVTPDMLHMAYDLIW